MNSRFRRLAVAAISLESIAILVLLCRPLLTGRLIDGAMHGRDPVILSAIVAALAITWLVRALQLPLRDRLLGRIGELLHLRLRGRVLGGMLETRGGSADRLAETVLIAEQAPRLVLDALSTVLRMALGSCLLACIHPDFLFAILPVMLVCLAMSWKGQAAGISAAGAVAQARALERTGWDEIIATRGSWTPPGWDAWMAASVAARAERRGDLECRAALMAGWWQPAMSMAATVGVILLLLLGSSRIASGELSAGDLAAAIFLTFLAIGPVLEISACTDRWTAVTAAWRRLKPESPRTAARAVHGRLSWEDLVIAWPQGGYLRLPGGSLDRGGRLLVVGSSGSGKSSLLRCLAGSMQPSQGAVDCGFRTVLIEHSQPLPPWPIDELLLATAASAGTALDLHDIRMIAVACGIDDLIAHQPDGYAGRADRIIGTPAGQAVAILAGRLSGAVLLLDEATSLLPVDTADRIMAALASHGCSMVVAAHRRAGMDDWPVLDLGSHAQGA